MLWKIDLNSTSDTLREFGEWVYDNWPQESLLFESTKTKNRIRIRLKQGGKVLYLSVSTPPNGEH